MPDLADIPTRAVRIPCADASLDADLALPAGAIGLVLFAHGSGSSRHSPRNREVARALNEGHLATLLPDLLTPQEAQADATTGEHRFDIALLASRLECAFDWAVREPELAGLPLGCFGASTGSAAALIVAARRGEDVRAVVSRGGRPDLAGPAMLALVGAPTLLLVGGEDAPTLALNQQARRRLRCEHALQVVPGAGHLFEEPGALETVSQLARDWFVQHLGPG